MMTAAQVKGHATGGLFEGELVQNHRCGCSEPDVDEGTAAAVESLPTRLKTCVEVAKGRRLSAASYWALPVYAATATELCGWLPGQYVPKNLSEFVL